MEVNNNFTHVCIDTENSSSTLRSYDLELFTTRFGGGKKAPKQGFERLK